MFMQNLRVLDASLCFLALCAVSIPKTLWGLESSTASQSMRSSEVQSDDSAELEAVIQRTLRAARYEISPVHTQSGSAARFAARNPAQRMQAEFSTEGVIVQPWGSSDGNPWVFALRLESVGYEGDPMPVDDAVLVNQGNEVEFHRGDVIEWYVNDACGLEQGFTLNAPPVRSFGGTSASGNLEVNLNLDGSLFPTLFEGATILLRDEFDLVVLRIMELLAYDAFGSELESSFALKDGKLLLRVDATRAIYPITIDSLIAAEQTALTANDAAAGEQFGTSVALSGNTALVGAINGHGAAAVNQGSAYVFVRNGATWSQQAKLTASDAAAGDGFGGAVSLDGDTAVIGASDDDSPGVSAHGSAYVFVRIGANWSQQAKLTASDAGGGDRFGAGVAVSGDTALVGASSDDGSGGLDQGSAYVFVRTGGNWNQQAKLVASDAAANDSFGGEVALEGDTAFVAASSDDDMAGVDQGSAYVFVRSGVLWSQQQKLTASDAATGDFFGGSIAFEGESALVGASVDDGLGGLNQGSAYVFVRNGTVWSQQQKLTAGDAAFNDFFGTSVALSGDSALIGAYGDDFASGTNQGSAYLFVRSGTVWSQEAKLSASDGTANDRFGFAVALRGDTGLVAANLDDAAAGSDQGSVYVFVFGTPCTTDSDCLDANSCTCDQCVAGACQHLASFYGDLACNATVDVDDILYVLSGFADPVAYPASDIEPCGGDGDVDVDDILAMLDAFAGGDPCGC